MLGFVSRFGSSKGMVAIPNLLGINSVSAASQLASSGLRLSPLSGTRNTNVISEGGISLSQTPTTGSLIDYDSEITITFGNYVADTVSVSVCQTYGTTTNDPDYCSGTLYVYGSARTKRRKTVTTTNNVTGTTTTAYDNSCTDDVVSRGSAYLNGQCGYSPPPVTCTATTNYGAYGACNAAYAYLSSGTKTRTISGTNSNCTTFSYPDYASCCQEAYQLPWSGWTPLASSNIYESRTTMFQNTSCTRYRVYESRCRTTTTITYGGCGSNKRRIQTTKVKNLCTNITTTTTASVPCNAV
jgi:hypothetical protein